MILFEIMTCYPNREGSYWFMWCFLRSAYKHHINHCSFFIFRIAALVLSCNRKKTFSQSDKRNFGIFHTGTEYFNIRLPYFNPAAFSIDDLTLLGRLKQRINPVASLWSYKVTSPKEAIFSLYRLYFDLRPAEIIFPLYNFNFTVPVVVLFVTSKNLFSASQSGEYHWPK